MPVYRLDDNEIAFPDPKKAEPDGLLAIGGDLSKERLLLAYSHGIFPWYSEGEPIMWWCPHERYIIRPENIHISHSLRKFIRKNDVKVVFNRDFADTMHRCRTKREFNEGTWITDDMERAYCNLNKEGYAVSVDAIVNGEVAGGLYGVTFGKCFFGESMFSDSENGSKIALVSLAKVMLEKGMKMIDCQFHTDHLESMGGESISYDEYMRIVNDV